MRNFNDSTKCNTSTTNHERDMQTFRHITGNALILSSLLNTNKYPTKFSCFRPAYTKLHPSQLLAFLPSLNDVIKLQENTNQPTIPSLKLKYSFWSSIKTGVVQSNMTGFTL